MFVGVQFNFSLPERFIQSFFQFPGYDSFNNPYHFFTHPYGGFRFFPHDFMLFPIKEYFGIRD